jgi:2-keto-3-deoxy-L-rhamnonate aldolase RhmA
MRNNVRKNRMRKSKVLTKLRQGQPARLAMLGHFIPPFIAYAAHEGYDGIWLDLEHRAMEQREVQALLALFHHYDIDCMLRPATREKALLYRYLEDGATGLIVPHVSDAETAHDLVNKVRYPPIEDRGLAGIGLDANYGLDSDVVQHANSETFLFVQIETVEAVNNLEAIATVEGIDGLYIGPADLGLRMSFEPDATRKNMSEVMLKVATVCAAHEKAWGSFAVREADVEAQVELGANLLVWGADFMLLRRGIEDSSDTLTRIMNTKTAT